MPTFLLLVLISFNAMATDWNSLIEKKDYKLTQSFSLKQNERSGSTLEIMKDDKVQLQEIVPLGSVPVALYIFEYKNCPGDMMTTEMEIIPVQGTSPVVEIGAQLENCKLNIYIETKDLMSNSLFE